VSPADIKDVVQEAEHGRNEEREERRQVNGKLQSSLTFVYKSEEGTALGNGGRH